MSAGEEKLIDGRQLGLLLFLGRMFSMMTYAPGREAQPGAAALAAQLPALALELLVVWFAFWAVRRCGGGGLLAAAFGRSRALGRCCAAVGLVFCAAQGALTLTVQTDFLTGTIYQQQGRLGLLLALWGGVLYAVWLGLEAFARMSMGVLALFGLLALALVMQTAPAIDLLNLRHPLEEGWAAVAQSAALNLSRSGELGAAVLLIPAVRDKADRWTVRACLGWRAASLLFAFLGLTVLGSFAATRSYPIYTLALAGGEQAVFGRLDALMLLVWIFLAVIRGAMFVWLGARCAARLLGGGHRLPFAAAGGATLLLALAAGGMSALWSSPLLWGGLLAAVVVALPLAVLIFRKTGGKAA